MRAAGLIVGTLALGMFVIPGAYLPNRESGQGLAGSSGRLAPDDEPTATLSGRVFDESGTPVAGAEVSLAGSGFWPPRAIASDAEGRFEWARIPAGVYELRISRGSLVAPAVEGLILDPGASRAFAVRLARGWLLSGRVVDARSGSPVAGATVSATTGPLGLHARRTTSDAQGYFELAGVLGDRQTVYVEAEGYVLGGPLAQAATDPPRTVRLQRAARVEGRVMSSAGRPVRGAVVQALGETKGATPGLDSLGVTAGPVPPISAATFGELALAGQTTTDADGRFALEGLAPGAYRITATHDELAPASSEPLDVRGGSTRSGVVIELRAGAELRGVVVDERGQGLEGIPVELRATGALPRMAITEPGGSFSFLGVRGEVTLTALPYGLGPARKTLRVDEDDGLVTVEIALSSALSTLRGRVVDERDFGIEGVMLTVRSEDPERPIERAAKSGADGSFSVPALPPPPYSLRAEHPSYGVARLRGVSDLEDVRVVLAVGVTLVGTVRDGWSGEPLGGVDVTATGPTEARTTTRRDGSFRLERLPPGTYDVSLTHDDYEGQGRRIVLEPPRYVDRSQELETVRLEPGGVVEGEVVDANGVPVPAAEVAWGDPPKWARGVRTNLDGAFRLRGVHAGSEWITARHDTAGEGWTSNPVTVRPLETSPGALIRLPAALQE